MNDRLYWLLRNGSAYLLCMLILPIFHLMFACEAIYGGLRIVLTMDGSEQLSFPWEIEWPFFRDEDDEA